MAGLVMKKTYKKILLTIISLFIITVSLGISYAVYNSYKNSDIDSSLVITDEVMSVNYLDGNSFDITNLKKNDIYTKKVSITNVSSEKTYVTLSIMDVNKTSDNINIKLVDNENNVLYDKLLSNIDTDLIKTVDLLPGKTLSYTIILENVGEDSDYFSANILVYKEIIKKSSKTFKETILENNKVNTALTEIGKSLSKENEGLIKTNDDNGEAYFFRGSVDNNYVTFANFEWRILRINGDSSIRLILNGILDNTVAYNDNTEMVENYTDKLLFNNSTIKKELESWYNSNLAEFSKYIIDSSFCEDVNTSKEENNVLYLNPYSRIFTDNIPTLTCMGNKISSKIGLITADEVEYAGAYQKNSNTSFFLYNSSINNSYWTMSGSQILERNNVVDAISVGRDGSLNYEKKISTSMGIRPVISLDSNIVVSGTGTANDPYTISS